MSGVHTVDFFGVLFIHQLMFVASAIYECFADPSYVQDRYIPNLQRCFPVAEGH